MAVMEMKSQPHMGFDQGGVVSVKNPQNKPPISWSHEAN